MWIQTGVTVRKWLSWFVTSVILIFDFWPWPFAWTLPWSLMITAENFMMKGWWEHSQKGVTDGQTDGRTDRPWTDGQTDRNTIHRAAQCLVAAKNNNMHFDVNSFVAISKHHAISLYHYIAEIAHTFIVIYKDYRLYLSKMTARCTWYKKSYFRVKSFERKTIGKTCVMYKNMNKDKKSV